MTDSQHAPGGSAGRPAGTDGMASERAGFAAGAAADGGPGGSGPGGSGPAASGALSGGRPGGALGGGPLSGGRPSASPAAAKPLGDQPLGAKPLGNQPLGAKPLGNQPLGAGGPAVGAPADSALGGNPLAGGGPGGALGGNPPGGSGLADSLLGGANPEGTGPLRAVQSRGPASEISVEQAIALRDQAPEMYDLWLRIAQDKAATANYVERAPYEVPERLAQSGRPRALGALVIVLSFCGYLAWLGGPGPYIGGLIAILDLGVMFGMFFGLRPERLPDPSRLERHDSRRLAGSAGRRR